MFSGLNDSGFKAQVQSLKERRDAVARCRCPDARLCQDRDDLAGWFKSVGFAAGWKPEPESIKPA